MKKSEYVAYCEVCGKAIEKYATDKIHNYKKLKTCRPLPGEKSSKCYNKYCEQYLKPVPICTICKTPIPRREGERSCRWKALKHCRDNPDCPGRNRSSEMKNKHKDGKLSAVSLVKKVAPAVVCSEKENMTEAERHLIRANIELEKEIMERAFTNPILPRWLTI